MRRFDTGDSPTDNLLRHTSPKPRTFKSEVDLIVEKVGGAVEVGLLEIRKNGGPIGIAAPFDVSNKPAPASAVVFDDAVFEDEYEAFLTNEDSSVSIRVTDGSFAASPIS